MPNPSIWGPLIGLVLILAIVGPMVAGLSLLFTKHPRTRYFWIFGVLFAVAGGWWLSTLVAPERVFAEVFGASPPADVEDLDYEFDRHAHQGVFSFRFRASQKTVNQVLRWRILQEEALPLLYDIVPKGLETAPWWPPPWAAEAETYHGFGHGPQYRHIEEWLLHRPATGEVVYLMVGFADVP